MNAQTIYYILGIASIIGGAVVTYLAKRDADQEKRFDEKLTTLRSTTSKEDEVAGLRINAIKVEIKELETRLAHVEREYISRADHAVFRSELMTAVKDIGEQLNKSLDGFRASMEKILDRIREVENAKRST